MPDPLPDTTNRPTARIVRLPETELARLPRAVVGMLDLLPPPGEAFPLRERLVWLRTFASIFELAYGLDGEIKIEAVEVEAVR